MVRHWLFSLTGRKRHDSTTAVLLSNRPALKPSDRTRPHWRSPPAGLLPIKWKLNGIDNLPKELAVTPTSGEVEARGECKVGQGQSPSPSQGSRNGCESRL